MLVLSLLLSLTLSMLPLLFRYSCCSCCNGWCLLLLSFLPTQGYSNVTTLLNISLHCSKFSMSNQKITVLFLARHLPTQNSLHNLLLRVAVLSQCSSSLTELFQQLHVPRTSRLFLQILYITLQQATGHFHIEILTGEVKLIFFRFLDDQQPPTLLLHYERYFHCHVSAR